MKKFISTHPWRLEIVPALALILSISMAVIYHLRYADYFESFLKNARTHNTPGTILNAICGFVAVLWLSEIGINHRWIRGEQRKRVNWLGLILQFSILVQAWGASLIVFILHRAAIQTARIIVPWRASAGLLILVLCIAVLLETSRKYVPRQNEIEPPPPANILKCDSGFCYKEVTIDWIMVIGSLSLIITACISARLEHIPYMCVTGILGGGFCAWLGVRRVTITPQIIVAYSGPFKKRLNLAEITECSETFRESGSKSPPDVRKSLHSGIGPCLKVTTIDGSGHLFGMLRPHFACSLIESIIQGKTPR